jgi:hypothetical protein
VYGSYVRGPFTDDSDIDIAVVVDGFSGDLVEDTIKLMKIRRNVDNRIEPHPFSVDELRQQWNYSSQQEPNQNSEKPIKSRFKPTATNINKTIPSY